MRIVEMEVILTGRRAIFRDWGSPDRPKFERALSPAKLSWFWSYPVLVQKVTLRDLFALLGRMPDGELRRVECLAMSNIRPFLDEARSSRRAPLPKQGRRLTRIELVPSVVIDERWRSLDVRIETMGRSAGKRERYAFSLSPVAHLLDCEIHVDPRAHVTREHRRKNEKVGAYEYHLTLGEFLTAIFYELAFFGTPRQREASSEELSRRIEEMRTGKVKPVSLGRARAHLKRRASARR